MFPEPTSRYNGHAGLRQLSLVNFAWPCRRKHCVVPNQAQTLARERVSGWLPTLDGGSTSCFFHVLAFSSIEAREKSWQAFGNDPEWQAAYEASRADGPIVERMESVVMFPTDYSPIR